MNQNHQSIWSDFGNPLRRLLNPADGLAYQFGNRLQYSVFAFLSVSAIVLMLVPAHWIEKGTHLQVLADAIAGYWPKIRHDSEFLNSLDAGRGTKYVLFCTYCLVVVVGVLYFGLPRLATLLRQYGKPLTADHKLHFWLTLLFLVGFIYLFVFDTGMISSTTRVSKGIGRSQIVWLWIAVLSTALLQCAQLMFSAWIKRGLHLNQHTS